MSFDFTPRLLRAVILPTDIGVHFFTVVQIIRNHRIDIGQCQRVKTVDNLLRRIASMKGGNNRFQGNARVANQSDSVGIYMDWGNISVNLQYHVFTLYFTSGFGSINCSRINATNS